MKITCFNSSPRKDKGNTHIICEEFLKGAREAGADTDYIFLSDKTIHHCKGCFYCWKKGKGKCTIDDDMSNLLEKFINSDIVVMATPLYVDNVSGIMKNFIDRLIPLADPHFEKDINNETRHVKRYEKYPKIVVISNCGFPEQSHFKVLRLYFRRLARNMHSEVIGEIYRGEGELLNKNILLLKPIIWNYKKLLRKAGKEVVEKYNITESLQKELEKPLISTDRYFKGANKSWDSV